MKSKLNSNFIQYLNCQKKDEGFTLIELLVVIIITGILAAIAIPNFLNQDVKAKQSEAKQNIALVNKSQGSYRAENSSFASSFDVLAIGSVTGSGVSGSTTNYSYTIAGTTDNASIFSNPKDLSLKAYSGGAVRFANSANQSVIGTVLCEINATGTVTVAVIPNVTSGSAPLCNAGVSKTLSI